MAAKASAVLVAAALMCLLVAAAPCEAAITCANVAACVFPCTDYARGSVPAPPPDCCKGVRQLNGLARTTPDRQNACDCLKSLLKNLGQGYNAGAVAALPGKCGVSVGFTIGINTNCSTVK